MFFHFMQNNSGGNFHKLNTDGVTDLVVEAEDADGANEIAESFGLYFDGQGDCECCGRRWSSASNYSGDAKITVYDFKMGGTGIVLKGETSITYLTKEMINKINSTKRSVSKKELAFKLSRHSLTIVSFPPGYEFKY